LDQRESEDPIPTKLFVGNLDYGTSEDDLRELFAQAGEVVSVTLPIDRTSGQPRGFAFVEMSTDEQAGVARERLHGQALRGRPLRVDAAAEGSRAGAPRPNGHERAARSPFPPGPRSRPKGSRRNLRARKRSL
jgi:RNA recognition motif-containing protein